jgi:hypothetical protein
LSLLRLWIKLIMLIIVFCRDDSLTICGGKMYRNILFFGIMASILCFFSQAYAAVMIWNNASGGSWFNSTNWYPPIVPESQDTAVIEIAANYEVLIDSGHVRVNSLELGSANDTTWQWLTVGWQACSLTVNKNFVIHRPGFLNISNSGSFFLADSGITLSDSGTFEQILGSYATLGFHDTLHIMGEGIAEINGGSYIVGDSGFVWNSHQLRCTDMGMGTIATNYMDDFDTTATFTVEVTQGGLIFNPPDSAVFNSKVRIEAGAELQCYKSKFKSTSEISGAGTLSFEGGDQEVSGSFPFYGNLQVVGGIVNFNPIFPQVIAVDTFTMDTSATFATSVTINATVANVNGGSTNGSIVTNQYNWSGGNLSGYNYVDAGASFNLTSNATKILDNGTLSIAGILNVSGSGGLTMLNGAQITVNEGGSMIIHSPITITGATYDTSTYHFSNLGHLTFDSPLDTVVVTAFIFNYAEAKTPGTIDILSGHAECGAGRNFGTINVANGSVFIMRGDWINYRRINMASGSGCVVQNLLLNGANGVVNLSGNAQLGGNGVVINYGHLNCNGSNLYTATNSVIYPFFNNMASTGSVDVITNTLTLMNGGTNAGRMNIHSTSILHATGAFSNLEGGVIQGDGTLDIGGDTLVNSGIMNPGDSLGTVTILGNLKSSGTINIELGGSAQGTDYDHLTVSGHVSLGGTLHFSQINGFIPTTSDTFHFFSFGSFSGEFANITGADLGNGTYLNIQYGPNGIVQFVTACSEGAQHSVLPEALVDSVRQNRQDTTELQICNPGQCPLLYTAHFTQFTPDTLSNPLWLTIIKGDTGEAFGGHCTSLKARIQTGGLAIGSYSGQIVITCNVHDDSVIVVPVELVVPIMCTYDLGGGEYDFSTFAEAENFLYLYGVRCPTVINVYPGTYHECVWLYDYPGLTAENTLTFRGTGGDNPWILSENQPALVFDGADHIIFDGIWLESRNYPISYPYTVWFTNDADSNELRNLGIQGAGNYPDYVGLKIGGESGSGCDGNLIDNIWVEAASTAIKLGDNGSDIVTDYNNEIRNVQTFEALVAIEVANQHGNTVHHCDIWSGYDSSVGVLLSGQQEGDTARIYCNRIHLYTGSDATEISVPNPMAGWAMIYNNFIYISTFQDMQIGGSVRGLDVRDGAHVVFDFNSIRLDGTLSSISTVTAINVVGNSGTSLTLLNNAIEIDQNVEPCYTMNISGDHPNVISDFNAFYGTGTSNFVGVSNSVTYSTLEEWRLNTGQDLHSVQGNPGFIDSTNLHIDGAYQLLDGVGTPISDLTTDIDSDVRQNPPDIGADEFTTRLDSVSDLVIAIDPAANNVILRWSPVAGANSYSIYCDGSSFGLNMSHLLATTTDTFFTHESVLSPEMNVLHLVYAVAASTMMPPGLITSTRNTHSLSTKQFGHVSPIIKSVFRPESGIQAQGESRRISKPFSNSKP